jgi:hypothetical protein
MWGNRARKQLNESINQVRNVLNESFAQHNIPLQIPALSGASGDAPSPNLSREQLEENSILNDSQGNPIHFFTYCNNSKTRSNLSVSRSSSTDSPTNPWEDPTMADIPIPAEHKTLVDSLQSAIYDTQWLVDTHSAARLSGQALDQCRAQAEAAANTLKSLLVGTPLQSVPELRPYHKYACAVRSKLAALVVKLNNNDHDRTAVSVRHREPVHRQTPARDRTSSHIQGNEEALRSAEHNLRHYMKRLKIGSFPSLRALNDPETLRLAVEVDLPQIKSQHRGMQARRERIC